VLWSLDVNPYDAHLGDRDALEVIAATPRQLASLVDALAPESAERPPAPDKWSVREVLCHLADSEIVLAFRLRQTLAEDHHVIQPFDQDLWARNYGTYSIDEALAVFTAVRQWNIALIRRVIPQALSRTVTHPERGQMTFQTLIETMAGHSLGHLRQIERIVAQPAQA
jgi:hypothetical protein